MWVPFDQVEDAPFAPTLEYGRVLLIFEDGTDLESWLSAYRVSERTKMVPMNPPGIEKMVPDYQPQIQFFAWIERGRFRSANIFGKLEGRVIETLPFWQLKMWAQYVQGDAQGYKETIRENGGRA